MIVAMRSRLAREDGIAMVIAMSLLAVLTLLSAAALSSSTLVSGASNRDANSKKALAAAEAGLEIALARLNTVKPAANQCLTTAGVSPGSGGAAAGQCPGLLNQDLGNGSNYGYYVTDTAQAPDCGGSASAGDRCITAIGNANDATRRVQLRASSGNIPLFAFNGLLGLNGVELGNNANIDGDLGSDGAISIGNNSSGTGCILSPTGSLSLGNGTTCPESDSSTTFASQVASVNTLPFATTCKNNDNLLITPLTTYTPGKTSVVCENGDSRTVLAQNASLVFPTTAVLASGDYNLCDLELRQNAGILIPAGAKVRIYIDSYARTQNGPQNTTQRGCPSPLDPVPVNTGQGKINDLNPAWSGNPNPTPDQLQIYVYGDPNNANPPNTKIDLSNSQNINAYIFAPNSEIELSNSPTDTLSWSGVGIGSTISGTPNNFTFVFDENASQIPGPVTGGAFKQKLWVECKRLPTTSSNPESGCP